MKRIKLSKDLDISRIVHGHWRLDSWGLSDLELLDTIKKAVDIGVTTLDHADIYGNYTCEKMLGDALKHDPSMRDKLEIITKCGIRFESANKPENDGHYYDTSEKHIVSSVENSLKNFGTDYIDLMLIHRPDFFCDPEEVASAFSKLKKEGKVKNFGVSNFLPQHFDMLKSYLDVDLVTNQIELSPCEVKHFEDGTLENALKHRIKPMAWSPLGGGDIFTSNDKKNIRIRKTLEKVREEIGAGGIDEVVYAWLLSHPAKIIPIVGSGKLSRLENAVKAMEYKLNRRQWFKILEAARGKEVD